MKIGNANPYLIDFDPYSTNTVQQAELGAHLDISDGRSFRYARNGTGALGVGKLATAPAPKVNHHNMAVQAAAAIGATSVSVTLGATASVAQEYAEGYLTINLTPGQGQVFKISDQPATSSAGTQTVTIYDSVQVALTTSSKANLVHSPYNGSINAAVATTRSVGVALTPVAASVQVAVTGAATTGNVYFWGQAKGPAAVLADGAIALGSRFGPSGAIAGAVTVDSATYATALATTPVGVANIMAGVDTEYRPMFLTVD